MVKKVFLILGGIFFSLGLALSIAAIATHIGTTAVRERGMRDAVPVSAMVVDVRVIEGDSRVRVYVEYEVDGETIISSFRRRDSFIFERQLVDIYVSAHNPRNIVSGDSFVWVTVLVLSIIGGVFTILGAGFLIARSRMVKRHRWLLDFGIPVWANVLGADENWNIVVNGQPAMVLLASYGNMQFVSGAVSNNDLAFVGEHVKVFYDPDNFSRYTFDLKNESARMPFEDPKPLEQHQ